MATTDVENIREVIYEEPDGFDSPPLSDDSEYPVKIQEGGWETHNDGFCGEHGYEAGDDEAAVLEIQRSKGEDYHLTDTGNGRRLVDKHVDDIRYCVDDKEWYLWDGVRWCKDVVKRMRELAKDIAVDIRDEAGAMDAPASTDNKLQDKEALAEHENCKQGLMKWANRSESAFGVTNTIRSAGSDPRIICYRSAFDQIPHLINCANGVVDLNTGTRVPHDRTFMMSRLCPLDYDPSAVHIMWEESLEAFTRHHPDLSQFLKTLAGYSIQGDKTEERILILHGPASAGKGTFVDCLTNAIGPDYACTMDASSVLKQKRNSAAPSGDIARLEGVRLVVVSEIEKGSSLQESFMKQASGNDAMVARGLYMSDREFRPTHQFWFQTNYRPGFDATDSGNKRRYLEIPFDNDLRKDPLVEFKPKLKIQMRKNKDFLKAVLAWTVAGAVEWHQNGLVIPESVKAATKALFAHNDSLKNFLSEMCIVGFEEKVLVKAMSQAYKGWCAEQGENPDQRRTFNSLMEDRGYERRQARVGDVNGKAWTGVRLKDKDELAGNVQSFPLRKTLPKEVGDRVKAG
jgi:putative DNA primase/helicase